MEVLTAATQYLAILMIRTRATCTKMLYNNYLLQCMKLILSPRRGLKLSSVLKSSLACTHGVGRELVSNYAHLNRSTQSRGRVPCCSHSSSPPHPHRQTAKPTGHDACEIVVVQLLRGCYMLLPSANHVLLHQTIVKSSCVKLRKMVCNNL